MTISILQERATDVSGIVSSLSLAFVSSVTSGSSIHSVGSCASASSLGSSIACADNVNGTYGTALDNIVDTGDNQRQNHWKFDSSASGTITVTVTPANPVSFVGVGMREIGGTSGYDTGKHSGAVQPTPGTGANAIAAGSVTPASQPGLLSAFCVDSFNTETSLASGTGFTSGMTGQWQNVGCLISEHLRYTTLSAQNATFTDATTGGTHTYTSLVAFFKETASGGVTVALIGQSATLAAGSLVPSSSKALLGQSSTTSTGALVPSLSKALIGASGTLTAGTLSPSTTVALLGSLVTGTAGIVTASGGTGGDLTLALIGQRSAFAQGALGVSITVALSGSSSTGTSGTVQPGTSPSLVGASATSSTGLMTPSLAVSLLGKALQGTPGIIAPSVSLSLNGNLGSFSQGSLAPSTSVNLVGISNSTNAGQLVSSGGDIITTQTASMLLIRRGFRKKR